MTVDNIEGEPLHTGDDERLDLLTSLRAGVESLLEDDAVQVPDFTLDALNELGQLDRLIVATIHRERRLAAFCRQVAADGILPSLTWFTETADALETKTT